MNYTAQESLQYITGPTGAASGDQLQAAWIAAGGDPSTAHWAVSIGQAEQGQYAWGINSDPPGASAGAWQIHYDNWGTLQDNGIISSPNDLKNLTTNAAAAIFMSGNGKNWSPWTTARSVGAPPYSGVGTGVPSAVVGTGLQLGVNLSGDLFNQYASLLQTLDPFAVALIVVAGLIVFGVMGWSNKFASYAAVIIFLLLMIHSSAQNGATPNGTSSASVPPASQITQPKVTYQNVVADNSGSSSSGGGGDSGILGIASLIGLFG